MAVDNNFKPSLKNKYNVYSAPRNAIIRYAYSLVPIRKILARILPEKLSLLIRKILFRSDKKPKLSHKTRDFLRKHFEIDLRELSQLLGKDFIKWIS